jgi:hypothetical protein
MVLSLKMDTYANDTKMKGFGKSHTSEKGAKNIHWRKGSLLSKG